MVNFSFFFEISETKILIIVFECTFVVLVEIVLVTAIKSTSIAFFQWRKRNNVISTWKRVLKLADINLNAKNLTLCLIIRVCTDVVICWFRVNEVNLDNCISNNPPEFFIDMNTSTHSTSKSYLVLKSLSLIHLLSILSRHQKNTHQSNSCKR